jgi:hypothetical protein
MDRVYLGRTSEEIILMQEELAREGIYYSLIQVIDLIRSINQNFIIRRSGRRYVIKDRDNKVLILNFVNGPNKQRN